MAFWANVAITSATTGALGPRICKLPSHDGSPFFIAPHPVLAVRKTRYVGEPVAVVIAETLWQAMDAAEGLAVVSGA